MFSTADASASGDPSSCSGLVDFPVQAPEKPGAWSLHHLPLLAASREVTISPGSDTLLSRLFVPTSQARAMPMGASAQQATAISVSIGSTSSPFFRYPYVVLALAIVITLDRRHTQQACKAKAPQRGCQEGRRDQHQTRPPRPGRPPTTTMRQVQIPPSAKHDHRQGYEGPVQHPQRGCEGQPGRRSTYQAEQARQHSSPGERQEPAQQGRERCFYLPWLGHCATPHSRPSPLCPG